MSATRVAVLVRDGAQLLGLPQVAEWDRVSLVGALSADPRTFEELEWAWLRDRPGEPLSCWPWAASDGISPDGYWLLIDLSQQCLFYNHQRVWGDDAEDGPWKKGCFWRDETRPQSLHEVACINLAPWWEFVAVEQLPEALASAREPNVPFDYRSVLYGPAMAMDLAEQMVAQLTAGKLPREPYRGDNDATPGRPATENEKTLAIRWHHATVDVHAQWLMTPRDDLNGHAPRHFLHHGRAWIDADIDYRRQQWMMFHEPPTPLSPNALTYHYGPMGTVEVVMYFDYCRQVLESGWRALTQDQSISVIRLAELMHEAGQQWLRTEDSFEGMVVPAEAIAEDRRRMPQIARPNNENCDCPICRMMAETNHNRRTPTFNMYDGHYLELDDNFAFSLFTTHEEWKQETFFEVSDEEIVEEDCPEESCWDNSLVDNNLVDNRFTMTPLSRSPDEITLLSLAFAVAEVVSALQIRSDSQDDINRINRAFDALRAAARDNVQRRRAVVPFEQVIDQLSAKFPLVAPKFRKLQELLGRWARLQVTSPT